MGSSGAVGAKGGETIGDAKLLRRLEDLQKERAGQTKAERQQSLEELRKEFSLPENKFKLIKDGFEKGEDPQKVMRSILSEKTEVTKTNRLKDPVKTATSAVSLRGSTVTGGSHPVDPMRLRDEVFANLSSVPEFKKLADLADHHGYDLWGLGGIAGNILNHFRQRMRQQDGDTKFRADYFGSLDLQRIMNVQTQDMDLVIGRKDGRAETEKEIEEFETVVKEAVPGIDIDVRGLRTAKDAIHLPLLDHPDFLLQHHNTVDYLMVQFNAKKSEKLVNDLADWGNSRSKNIVDCANGTIRFNYSSRHTSSSIAGDGHSPDIKHVMRLLIKMARYDAKPDPASLERMKKVVEDFDPDITDGVVSRWFDKNAAKLALDAIDLPGVWDTLGKIGLLDKLQKLNNPDLAVLFAREPLTVKSKGSPTGKTAKDLGVDVVTHGTSSLELWNAICRTPYKRANIFTSRPSGAGEMALLGEGVYTVEGKEGLGAGYNVPLRLAPDAREGVDFNVFDQNAGGGPLERRWVVLLNSSKVTLAPIDLKFSTEDMVRELLNPESLKRQQVRDFYTNEMGRRSFTEADQAVYAKFAGELLDQTTPETGLATLKVIASVPKLLTASPELIDRIIAKLYETNAGYLSHMLLETGDCEFSRQLMQKALESPVAEDVMYSLAQYFFPFVEPGTFREELWRLIDTGNTGFHQYLFLGGGFFGSKLLSQHLPDAYHFIKKTEYGNHLKWLDENAARAQERPDTPKDVIDQLEKLRVAIEKRKDQLDRNEGGRR